MYRAVVCTQSRDCQGGMESTTTVTCCCHSATSVDGESLFSQASAPVTLCSTMRLENVKTERMDRSGS